MTFSCETVMKRGKILCALPTGMLAWRKGIVGIFDENERTFSPKIDLRKSLRSRICSVSRFAERCLRETPRCAAYFDNRVFIALRGYLAELELSCGIATESFRFRDGMRSPLKLSVIEGVAGFDDCLAFGDYWGNPDRAAAEIHALCRADNCWRTVAVIPAGTLCHIHAIIPDTANGCVYALTGDANHESSIIKYTNNFQQHTVLATGSQDYRSCVAAVCNGRLVYATDSPVSRNSLNRLEDDDITRICELRGSCIYFDITTRGDLVFSTAVEPDPRVGGWGYRLSLKPGPGIVDDGIDVCITDGNCMEIIASFRKDCWPAWLCQFGTVEPVVGKRGIYLNCSALKGHDRDVLIVDGGVNA